MKRFGLLVFAAVVTAGSSAQELPPNETDLFAAYCMGYFKGSIASLQQARGGAAGEYAAEILTDEEKARRRTAGYLIPRTKFLDVAGLATASKQAEEDYQEASKISTCIHQCKSKPDCYSQCTAGDKTSEKFARCRAGAYLPY